MISLVFKACAAILFSFTLTDPGLSLELSKFMTDGALQRLEDTYGRDRDERDYVVKWDALLAAIEASDSVAVASTLIAANQDFLFARLVDPQPWFYSDVKGFTNSHTVANAFIQQHPALKQAFRDVNEAAAARALGDAGIDFNKLAPLVIQYRPTPSGQAALVALVRLSFDRGLTLISSLFLDALLSDAVLRKSPVDCNGRHSFGYLAKYIYELAGRGTDAAKLCPLMVLGMDDLLKERSLAQAKFQRLHLARLFSRVASEEETLLFKTALHLSGVEPFVTSQVAFTSLPSHFSKPGDLLGLLVACLDSKHNNEGEILQIPYLFFALSIYSDADSEVWARNANAQDYLCRLKNEEFLLREERLREFEAERRAEEWQRSQWSRFLPSAQ